MFFYILYYIVRETNDFPDIIPSKRMYEDKTTNVLKRKQNYYIYEQNFWKYADDILFKKMRSVQED